MVFDGLCDRGSGDGGVWRRLSPILNPYVEGCNETCSRVQKAGFTMTSGLSRAESLYPPARHKLSDRRCLRPAPRPVAGGQNRGEIEPGVAITPYKGVGAHLRTPP